MRTDTTVMGHGGSVYANERFDAEVPLSRVKELFNFEVEYTPLYTHISNDGLPGEMVPLENRQAIRRTDNGLVLNTVSKSHGLHQFEEVLIKNLVNLLDASEGDLKVSGAGLLKNGAVGWIQVQADCLEAGNGDVAPTLTLASSHDGSLATSYRMGMYRFACSNQIGTLRKGGANVYKLRHTINSKMNFTTARQALGMMWKQADEFDMQVKRLIDTEVTTARFDEIVNRLMPIPKDDATEAAKTRSTNRRDSIFDIYMRDDRVKEFTGTGWGVVQAFNTYSQHERPFRATGSNGDTSRLGRTMKEFLAGGIDEQDQRVTAAVLSLAGSGGF